MGLDLAALKAELLGDPQGLGYAAPLALGNHAALAALLNDATRGGTLQLPWADADLVRSNVVASEYATLSAADKAFLNFLLGGSRLYLTAGAKAWVQGLASFAGSKAAIAPLFTRPQSRAEALFGEGASVTHLVVADALAT